MLHTGRRVVPGQIHSYHMSHMTRLCADAGSGIVGPHCSIAAAAAKPVLQALVLAYPSMVVLMLWGNVNSSTKELFRDQLMVRTR